jgi:metal-responsive CopG/Arc/MetJ family transcriptional regulator
MNTNTVNIAFKKDLLELIDKVAKTESRSRSELIREAARMYIERKNKWEMIFKLGRVKAKENNFTENDILNEIKEYRTETQVK